MGLYQDALTTAMDSLSLNKKVVFLGQSVAFPGTAMRNTLENISDSQL